MPSLQQQARAAGLWYLSLAVTAPFSLIYVPGKLIIRDDAAATASNVLAHETLFRLALVGRVVTPVLFVFTALALYRLLERVDRRTAVAMAVLALLSVPIAFANVVNQLAVLTLIDAPQVLSPFSPEQRQALAMLFSRLTGYGHTVEGVFWGLWLFPLGLLVYRSGFLPRLLGVVLLPNGLAYVVDSFTALLAPQHRAPVSQVTFPFLFGEFALVLWLVIRGARAAGAASATEREGTARAS